MAARALILPCLGRTEKDHRRGGIQGITVEDSMSMVHLSCRDEGTGFTRLAVGMRRSSLASRRAALPGDDDTVGSTTPRTTTGYATRWREVIEGFEDFNRRVRQPLGFRMSQPARELVFLNGYGSRGFFRRPADRRQCGPEGTLLLGTVRSHDQWNTTIYSDDDRYRGMKNLRTLVFMNTDDMRERELKEFDDVDIVDHRPRRQHALRARVQGDPLQDTARQRRGLHARDECAVRHR